MNNKPFHLKIGLDYHGVINNNLTYFRLFCAEAIQKGYEIHILTGGPHSIVAKQLSDTGIKYSRLFTIIDYYRKKGQAVCLPDGEWFVEDGLWNRAKAKYCTRYKIDILIDDSFIYGQYFKTPYCLYNTHRQDCKILSTNQMINFSEDNPQKAIEQIEKICYEKS